MRRGIVLFTAAALGLSASVAAPVRAAVFASGVVSATQGSAAASDGFLSTFNNASATLGSPDAITGENENGFPNVLNPFSPAYETDEIYLIGQGGHLTLRLPNYALVGPGLELGVISNAGLQDRSFTPASPPPGTNFNPALSFSGGVAEVRVSEDGVSWVSLGKVTFNLPTNYYTNLTGPYEEQAPNPATPADFGKPFDGTLSMFDNKNFADTISTLDGSGGGTWLDLSNRGLTRVGYVDFIVTDDTPNVIDRLSIDAVVIANGKVGPSVPLPEPVGFGWIATLLAAVGLCRKRVA